MGHAEADEEAARGGWSRSRAIALLIAVVYFGGGVIGALSAGTDGSGLAIVGVVLHGALALMALWAFIRGLRAWRSGRRSIDASSGTWWSPGRLILYAVTVLTAGALVLFAAATWASWLGGDLPASVGRVVIWVALLATALLVVAAIFVPVIDAVRESLDS